MNDFATAKREMLDTVFTAPLMPSFYHEDTALLSKVLKACYDGGVRVFQFLDKEEKSFEVYKALLEYKKQNCPDMYLGVGFVLGANTAKKYIAQGVDFIASPVLDVEIADTCSRHKKIYIPSCATLSEIHLARKHGAELVNLFPASIIGTDYVKLMLQTLPELNLMVTGGVTTEEANVKKWFSVGVKAIGMGEQLISKDLVSGGGLMLLTIRVKSVLFSASK